MWQKVVHWGWSVQCPFCGWQGRSFYPHLEPHPRNNALCPRCHSKERHRALRLYLEKAFGPRSEPVSILEIGPGPYSFYPLPNHPAATNYSLDYESSLAGVKGDICWLPYKDEAFDLLICCHVLEHVQDDRSAMQELRRVLDQGGLLLIQVPIAGEVTEEDPEVTEPEERLKLFGQVDHVRVFGRDIAQRLHKSGLIVQEMDFAELFSTEELQRYGLRKGELTYICRRVNK